MSPPDMEGGSPVSTDEYVVTSGEISTAMEPTPIGNTPITERLPPGYRALKDIMSSETPSMSSIWSPNITSTTGSFSPHDHYIFVTSATTALVVCTTSSALAASGPLISTSRIIDPILNMPHSSGPFLVEGLVNPLLRILQFDPSQPFGRPSSPQPTVKVSVPLSIGWAATHYHGGQATSPPLQGPPSHDQSSRQSYPRKPRGQQGQPFQGQPSASGGTYVPHYTQPYGNPGPSSVPQIQPRIQQGYPTRQVSQSHGLPNQLNVQYGQSSEPMGYSSVQQSQPNVQYTQESGHVGQPHIPSGQPTVPPNWPLGQPGQPLVAAGSSQSQQVHLSRQIGQPQYQPGHPSAQISHTSGHMSGATPPGIQMGTVSHPQPGFGPQAGPQTPSGFQMQGGAPFYPTPPVPQNQFGF